MTKIHGKLNLLSEYALYKNSMITPSDLVKIKNFDWLSPNHKRVFKYRLIRKCRQFQRDLEVVVLHAQSLNIDIDKVIDLVQFVNIIETYQNRKALQKMYTI